MYRSNSNFLHTHLNWMNFCYCLESIPRHESSPIFSVDCQVWETVSTSESLKSGDDWLSHDIYKPFIWPRLLIDYHVYAMYPTLAY